MRERRIEDAFNMNISALIVLSLCTVSLSAAATNYCKASLCKGKRHIGCKNNGAFGRQCARNAKVMVMKNGLKNTILAKHNTLRNRIAAGGLARFRRAGRMATMQWSNELSRLAVLNVKQCAMRHDACRATDQFPYPGQNLGYTSWSGGGNIPVAKIVKDHIQLWFNEHKDATMAQINRFRNNGKTIGHFVQMVLEKATHVGCGVVRHTRNGITHHYTACNYAFITFRNQPVYTRANRAASRCRTGRHSRYKALCSTREYYDVKNP